MINYAENIASVIRIHSSFGNEPNFVFMILRPFLFLLLPLLSFEFGILSKCLVLKISFQNLVHANHKKIKINSFDKNSHVFINQWAKLICLSENIGNVQKCLSFLSILNIIWSGHGRVITSTSFNNELKNSEHFDDVCGYNVIFYGIHIRVSRNLATSISYTLNNTKFYNVFSPSNIFCTWIRCDSAWSRESCDDRILLYCMVMSSFLFNLPAQNSSNSFFKNEITLLKEIGVLCLSHILFILPCSFLYDVPTQYFYTQITSSFPM